MLRTYRVPLILFGLAALAVIPHFVFGAIITPGADWSIIPKECRCGQTGGGAAGGQITTGYAAWGCVIGTLGNIVNLAAYLGIFIAILIIAYAGFLWVLNPVSPENRSAARQILINAAIGLALTLAAWLLVNTLVTLLGAQINGQTGVAGLTSELSKGGSAGCQQVADNGNQAPQNNNPGLSGSPNNGNGNNNNGGNGQVGGQIGDQIDKLHEDLNDPNLKGMCAKAVREAICAGGNDYYCTGHGDAYALGQTLDDHGYDPVNSNGYQPQAGDVAYFDPVPGHPDGHIEMYDGNQWESYFAQNGQTPYGQGFYAAKAYVGGNFHIFRPGG